MPTLVPPEGAALESVTVQILDAVEPRELGEQLSPETTGVVPAATVMLPPVPVTGKALPPIAEPTGLNI